MSDVDLSKLRKWIGKAQQIGEPPTPQSAGQRARQAGGRDALVQFNVKVAASVKKRAKQLAARDDIQLSTLVERMLDLYEKEYGALTGDAGKHR
jgi:hypothetical protein